MYKLFQSLVHLLYEQAFLLSYFTSGSGAFVKC